MGLLSAAFISVSMPRELRRILEDRDYLSTEFMWIAHEAEEINRLASYAVVLSSEALYLGRMKQAGFHPWAARFPLDTIEWVSFDERDDEQAWFLAISGFNSAITLKTKGGTGRVTSLNRALVQRLCQLPGAELEIDIGDGPVKIDFFPWRAGMAGGWSVTSLADHGNDDNLIMATVEAARADYRKYLGSGDVDQIRLFDLAPQLSDDKRVARNILRWCARPVLEWTRAIDQDGNINVFAFTSPDTIAAYELRAENPEAAPMPRVREFHLNSAQVEIGRFVHDMNRVTVSFADTNILFHIDGGSITKMAGSLLKRQRN